MKCIVLGGFLGAGKTTVLMQYARFLQQERFSQTPVVILENEISEAGVDNQLLTQAHFTVKNIFSGCICCTSSASLVDSVRQIREEYDPEWLLIEATGMAYPDSIRKTLAEEAHLPAAILALADAKRWKKVTLAMPDFVRAQMVDADAILLNKIDLVSEKQANETEQELRAINGTAAIRRISAIQTQTDTFWSEVTHDLNARGV